MTIREIALRCGVSRGTVDRVINGRGKVHPDTEALVLSMLSEAGYTKNIAGRALTVRKSAPVIGIVLSSEGNPFFDDVIAGIRRAESELADYGVSIALHTMRGYHAEEQLALIDALGTSISALVLHAINDPRIARKINALAEQGIPTVTVNTDLDNSQRRCYVGSDYLRGGHTAAGVVRLVTEGKARLGILTGVDNVLGHRQRLAGFEALLRERCPGITVAARVSAQDDIEHANRVTRDMLAADPAIDALMVIAAGLRGVCQAVMELGRERGMRIFAFDNTPGTKEMMDAGLVKAVVCQQPFAQGRRAVRAAFDIILSGVPGNERMITENQIRILENLDE